MKQTIQRAWKIPHDELEPPIYFLEDQHFRKPPFWGRDPAPPRVARSGARRRMWPAETLRRGRRAALWSVWKLGNARRIQRNLVVYVGLFFFWYHTNFSYWIIFYQDFYRIQNGSVGCFCGQTCLCWMIMFGCISILHRRIPAINLHCREWPDRCVDSNQHQDIFHTNQDIWLVIAHAPAYTSMTF